MKRKKTSKVLWQALWKVYDFRKRALRRLRAYHDSLSERTRRRIVLAMLALFALLSLYTVGKSVYGLLHGGGERMEIAPSERPEAHRQLFTKPIRKLLSQLFQQL